MVSHLFFYHLALIALVSALPRPPLYLATGGQHAPEVSCARASQVQTYRFQLLD